jgi:hypothetical protein
LRKEHCVITSNEHYFPTKSFGAVCEAFINAYSDKEVSNKTTIHILTKFQDMCFSVPIVHRATGEIMVVTILSSASAATTGYSYKKSILLSFSSA